MHVNVMTLAYTVCIKHKHHRPTLYHTRESALCNQSHSNDW